jgi:hypothetical protein
MPVYVYSPISPAAATSATTLAMSNWYLQHFSDNGTAATTTNTWYSATGSTIAMPTWVWQQWIDPVNDTGSTWVSPRPARLSQTRLYIARRSRDQAIEDDLRHHYAMEQRRQRRVLQVHDDAAHTRARELLLSQLTPAQRKTFDENKWFIIEGGQSREKYRINFKGHMVANVDVLDAHGDVLHRLCGHCDLNEVPIFDQLLAQKLMLECDEERFLRLANRHRA